MENSRLIARPAAHDIFDAFVRDGDSSHSTPARIAWTLESNAIEGGWPSSGFIGSERDLIERFHVGRDVMREAIRVVEARGLMRMRRGCKGGLHLVRPHLDQAAGVLAAYLRTCGCTEAELAETKSVVEPILADWPQDNLLVRLFRRTLGLLAGDESGDARDFMRGATIAMRIIQDSGPIPDEGLFLGPEAALGEKYSCGRSTFRQALRVLDDLGMLHVQRGRGGGYTLQRPSTIGVMRQLFSLLASRQQRMGDIVPMTWVLNVANLRLAMRRLNQMRFEERARRCDAIISLLDQSEEPHRWGLLQECLREIADNKLVDILLLSLVAYQARRGGPVNFSSLDAQLLAGEKGIVEALRHGDDAETERLNRHCQALISQLVYAPEIRPID